MAVETVTGGTDFTVGFTAIVVIGSGIITGRSPQRDNRDTCRQSPFDENITPGRRLMIFDPYGIRLSCRCQDV